MYRVSITLSNGEIRESVADSLLRAALMVESFRGETVGYTISTIDNTEGRENIDGGKTNVYAKDHRQRCIS